MNSKIKKIGDIIILIGSIIVIIDTLLLMIFSTLAVSGAISFEKYYNTDIQIPLISFQLEIGKWLKSFSGDQINKIKTTGEEIFAVACVLFCGIIILLILTNINYMIINVISYWLMFFISLAFSIWSISLYIKIQDYTMSQLVFFLMLYIIIAPCLMICSGSLLIVLWLIFNKKKKLKKD
ncbi:hypothetical protein [Spiroplasma endosymbiont of Aspidapion aeneum]|uniref:hypothetical protein n=1 Tax=Spiroplasma endosymbiont of Aspidapion aeneum TaxID=3066276 RepID=UPI00313BB2CD